MAQQGWTFPEITRGRTEDASQPRYADSRLILWDGLAGRGTILQEPVARVTGTSSILEVEGWNESKRWEGNPLDHLDEAFAWAAEGAARRGLEGACFGGAFHYDLRRCIERYAHPAPDDQGLPWLRWSLFAEVSRWSPADPGPADARELRGRPQAGVSSLPREAFERAVLRILQHEVEGDVYQVNLTRQVGLAHEVSPFALWQAAARASLAPFAAFAHLGRFSLLSLSPERFVARRGDTLWTQPIKGTSARGATPEEDAASIAHLLGGEKEAAELAMIVDVERNDLGRIALPGTVRVENHREVIALPNVYHLASTVRGTLRPGTGLAHILRATFPGGSVTGAPKIRAMQIIDDLEPVSRGYYCGALGWISPAGDMDLSLPIRTATALGDTLRLGVGGGIVSDSDPAAEWLETVAKAKCFLGD